MFKNFFLIFVIFLEKKLLNEENHGLSHFMYAVPLSNNFVQLQQQQPQPNSSLNIQTIPKQKIFQLETSNSNKQNNLNKEKLFIRKHPIRIDNEDKKVYYSPVQTAYFNQAKPMFFEGYNTQNFGTQNLIPSEPKHINLPFENKNFENSELIRGNDHTSNCYNRCCNSICSNCADNMPTYSHIQENNSINMFLLPQPILLKPKILPCSLNIATPMQLETAVPLGCDSEVKQSIPTGCGCLSHVLMPYSVTNNNNNKCGCDNSISSINNDIHLPISEQEVDEIVDNLILKNKQSKYHKQYLNYGYTNAINTYESNKNLYGSLDLSNNPTPQLNVPNDNYGEENSNFYSPQYREKIFNGKRFPAVENPFSNKFFVEQSFTHHNLRSNKVNNQMPKNEILYSPPKGINDAKPIIQFLNVKAFPQSYENAINIQKKSNDETPKINSLSRLFYQLDGPTQNNLATITSNEIMPKVSKTEEFFNILTSNPKHTIF